MKRKQNKKKILVLFIVIVLVFIFFNGRIVYYARILDKGRTDELVYTYDKSTKATESVSTKLVRETFGSKSLVKQEDKTYFFDFDNTYFGTIQIELEYELSQDTTFHIVLSEKSVGNHAWTRKDDGVFEGYGISYVECDVIGRKGESKIEVELPERVRPISAILPDDYKGGVYPFCCGEISADNDYQVKEVSQIAIHCDFNDNNSCFSTNNQVLNDVWNFSKHTIKATTYAGIYVDGFRELTPYEADTYVNELGHFSADNNYSMAKDTLEYLLDNHTWPTEWTMLTNFSVYEYYMYSGDYDFIDTHFEELEKCDLDELINDDGLIDINCKGDDLEQRLNITSSMRDIIDWPVNERDNFDSESKINLKNWIKLSTLGHYNGYMAKLSNLCGLDYAATIYETEKTNYLYGRNIVSSPNAVVNAFYYKNLDYLEFFANETGRYDKAEEYKEKKEQFREIYIDSFYDNSKKLVVDTKGSTHASLHSNMYALDFGLVPEDGEENVLNYISDKGMCCSPYGAQYLLEVLCKCGRYGDAINLMVSDGDRSWVHMYSDVGSGLTTEAWDSSDKINQDWNHAWSTAPVNICQRYIVGIKPSAPGFATASMVPGFLNLDSLNAKIPTNNGNIEINYNKNGEAYEVTLSIPENMKIYYYVPEDIEKVYVNNEIVQDKVIELNGNTYSIEMKK